MKAQMIKGKGEEYVRVTGKNANPVGLEDEMNRFQSFLGLTSFTESYW